MGDTATFGISVVIATYRSGDGLQRVVDSLDAQTMDADDFEVIFVDDGSGDGTTDRLRDIVATRPTWQVFEIENSGWASRPRNVGIEKARGEYVMFMDHDDSLYPDGLRRAYEYAQETGADLLSPKESKTNDGWWGVAGLRGGNLPDVRNERALERIIPLVPHKFYRRSMLLEHGIRFREGARVLWEDQFFNLDAYRHARVVSVLADTPVYLWHASETNSSHTFDQSRSEYWDWLGEVMAHGDRTLARPEDALAREQFLHLHLRVRVIDRMVRMLARRDDAAGDRALHRASKLVRRYCRGEVERELPRRYRILAELIRHRDRERLIAMHAVGENLTGTAVASEVTWTGPVLRARIEATMAPKNPSRPVMLYDRTGVMLALPEVVRDRIPASDAHLTDAELNGLRAEPVLRSRQDYLTWPVRFESEPVGLVETATGLGVRVVGTATIDLRTAAEGSPLRDNVWDLRMEFNWAGFRSLSSVQFTGATMPRVIDGRPAIAYSSTSDALSIDLEQRLRTLVSDALPAVGPAGTTDDLRVRLTRLPGVTGELPVDELHLVPGTATKDTPERDLESAAIQLRGSVRAHGDDAILRASTTAAAGEYRVAARRQGRLHLTRHAVDVAADGSASWRTPG